MAELLDQHFERQRGLCFWCGAPCWRASDGKSGLPGRLAKIALLLPASHGGRETAANTSMACAGCCSMPARSGQRRVYPPLEQYLSPEQRQSLMIAKRTSQRDKKLNRPDLLTMITQPWKR